MAQESGDGVKRKRLGEILREIFKSHTLIPDVSDVVTFSGLGGVCYGLAQIYPPAAWIIGGAALFWLGVRR